MAWSPDGQRLATAGDDGIVHVYAMGIDLLMSLARSRVTRNLTLEECRTYLHLDAAPPIPFGKLRLLEKRRPATRTKRERSLHETILLNKTGLRFGIAVGNSPSIKQTSAHDSQHRFTIGVWTWVSVGVQTKFNAVVNRLAQLLLASNVPLPRLHGGMPQQKLDLFDLASRRVADASATSA